MVVFCSFNGNCWQKQNYVGLVPWVHTADGNSGPQVQMSVQEISLLQSKRIIAVCCVVVATVVYLKQKYSSAHTHTKTSSQRWWVLKSTLQASTPAVVPVLQADFNVLGKHQVWAKCCLEDAGDSPQSSCPPQRLKPPRGLSRLLSLFLASDLGCSGGSHGCGFNAWVRELSM